jgi:hypothetical protein
MTRVAKLLSKVFQSLKMVVTLKLGAIVLGIVSPFGRPICIHVID